MALLGDLINTGAQLGGALISGAESTRAARRQIAYQREFAQNGIRWRVADAKAAGIHPLAALGAQTTGYTPVSTMGSGLGEGLAAMGQGIDRAISAKQMEEERKAEELYTKQLRSLDISHKTKELQKLDAEIDALKTSSAVALRRNMTPPPLPSDRISAMPGQGDYSRGALKVIDKYVLGKDTNGRTELLPSEDYIDSVGDAWDWLPYIKSWMEAFSGMSDYKYDMRKGWVPKSKKELIAKKRESDLHKRAWKSYRYVDDY